MGLRFNLPNGKEIAFGVDECRPTRKSKFLYLDDGKGINVLAYFTSDFCADMFNNALHEIAEATKRKE